jgi:uncharacterized protein (DUF2461 family)
LEAPEKCQSAQRRGLQTGWLQPKTPPHGYDSEHPLIEDLKRKDFILAVATTEENALAPDFIERFTQFCKTAAPVSEFLTRALNLEW